MKKCRRTQLLFLFFLVLSNAALYAQNVLKGRVTDPANDPLIGVNVVIKGTTTGTISDIDGNFELNVSPGNVLTFTYMGYVPQEITITNQTVLNVMLEEDTKTLDEIVVVSYGTQKKRNLTGAVSSLNASDLNDLPVGQLGQKLQGQIAGVQINQTTGKPGEGMAFRIRGAASVNAGNEPLFVVDGMVLSTGLNMINPDEIESFSVLKDAAAASLYGSRAANGVVLITTKKGRKGKTDVQFNASYGIQSLKGLKRLDMMDGTEFAQFQKEIYEDRARYEDPSVTVPEVYQNPGQYGKGTDWYKLMTRDAAVQNYSLSIMSGTEKLSSAIFFGYFNQEGVVLNTGFERFSLRSNNEYQVNDRIKIGLNIAPTLTLTNNHSTDGAWNILNSAILMSPCLSPYEEDGSLAIAMTAPNIFDQPNWLRVLQERTNKYKSYSIISNAFADVDIWNGISYRFQAGVDIGNGNYRYFSPSTSGGGMFTAPPQKASGGYDSNFYYSWTVENLLNYNKTFGDHSVDALLGYSAQKYTQEFAQINGTDFPDDDITWVDAAATKNGGSSMQQWSMVSLIARANYSYKDRYLLQATIRRDGCSRFGPENKYADFPSVSAGWIVSDEAFMEPVSSVMNYLKLRISYGLTGNYNIGNYNYISGVNSSNYVFGNSLVPGKSIDNLGNDYLTWEETSQVDAGVDFSFLNDRIFVMYDYYRKTTDGMLYQIDIPRSSGFASIQSNIGKFRSWGHEITISSRNLTGLLKWSTNLNLAFNRNKVLALGTNDTPVNGHSNQGWVNQLRVGHPIGVFTGYVFDGVYMTQQEFDTQPKHASSEIGTVRMKDVSGPNGVPDGIIDMNDRIIIGNPNPDMVFGMTNDFSWNNFDLSVLLTGQIGGDILNGNNEYTENIDGCFNVLRSVADRWRSPENPGNGLVPRTKSGTTELYRYTHSGWVYNATYLSVRNITIGYTVPLKSNNYISNLRVYLTAQNLKTFSKYPGMNPEVSENGMGWEGLGIDKTTYPVPRTFSIGCSIKF
ncbi:MAG: TonB-dependent receptor [Tannerellaceae bacterium]|nr:TonB-dependent receptor [Tannerellaceae bacterium]